ncbi:MAG: DUF454 domain-containing protein [Euryarchaeota archaeon]|nr:DUF454 domain-containing protein [Euryarchaeota archaeon]
MSTETFDEAVIERRCNVKRLNSWQKFKWNCLGTLALILGIIGAVLPVMPTVPFVLAAVSCYSRGSDRMYNMLVSNRLFGKMISDYAEGRGTSKIVKALSLTFLWISLTASFILFNLSNLFLIVYIIVGTIITIHVIRLPVKS